MADETKKEEEVIYDEESEAGDAESLDEAECKIKKMKEKLKRCNEEKGEYLAGWQREKADFINYRRRQEEQMAEWLKMAQSGLINDLLPILESLNHAERYAEQRGKEEVDVSKIKQQLWAILKKYGVEEIKAVGEKFNPEFHEAIEQVESEGEEGIVIEEVQKGYTLNGRVLRTAKVKVSR